MSKATAARRLAAATALGGGGLSMLGGSLYGVLRAEARLARRRIGDAVDSAPDASGVYGAMLPGRPIRLAVLGDSAAAGYGARVPQETFGAFLATGLSRLAQRPVRLLTVAVVGAKSADLTEQVPRALAINPDVCVVIVGTNDVTHAVRPSQSIQALREAVRALRGASTSLRPDGPEVVVGTCPDLGTVQPIAPPLCQVARRWSRRLAAAQTIAVVEAGARSVSLGTILGPEFAAAPLDLFGPDRFHPSVAGYRRCATAMLPSVAAVIGVLPEDGHEPEPFRGEGIFALARAAAVAADQTGVEVAGAEPAPGPARRPRRWVARLRGRVAISDVEPVAPSTKLSAARTADPRTGPRTGLSSDRGADPDIEPLTAHSFD